MEEEEATGLFTIVSLVAALAKFGLELKNCLIKTFLLSCGEDDGVEDAEEPRAVRGEVVCGGADDCDGEGFRGEG